jgi:uncharacterized hydrophobic protein (TIGR00271 family)
MSIFRNIIDDNKFTPEDVPQFEAKLFFEGANRRIALERFAVLLLLSTIIATYGVIGDAVATVIGAMIIAPLMRPIMGTTAGLIIGDMKRAARSFLVVVLGVAGVIALAWLITEITVTRAISFETNSQIIGRISPRLIDLYAALAAGAAGAFAMSREDIADSLPGVAIAISLVPPLCVVGVGLAEGELEGALGAMLLFITNLLAILLAGGGVLALLGLSAATMKELNRSARRKTFMLILIGLLLVIIPLGITSRRVFNQNQIRRETIQLAEDWMEGSGYNISRVEVSGDHIDLVIFGFGERPRLSDLGDQLDETLAQTFDLELIVLRSERVEYIDENE